MPVPPSDGLTRMPVPSAPTMPPMQWTPKTSSASSYLKTFFTVVQKKKQTKPATMPSTSEPMEPAKPEAGVTATRPATAPEIAPSMVGLPFTIHSMNIHAIAQEAVAMKVLRKATTAEPAASRFDPALKPNQPNHKRQAPMKLITSECGAITSRPKPMRLPTIKQPTKPAMPELMCTTEPPAKSMAPFL